MGGDSLNLPRRRSSGGVCAALLLALSPVVLAACASQGYRDSRVPAFVVPGPRPHGPPSRPIRLRDRDSVLLDGGVRIIRAERAHPAPFFAFTDEQGNRYTPQTLRGRVVWVDLWAVWCGTCRAEFPLVERLQNRFGPNGLTVLAVCRNSGRDGFVEATRKDWVHFPVVDASAQRDFPFPYRAFPTSVLIDREGRVRAYWQGHRTPEAMEEALRHLLAEEGPSPPESPVPLAQTDDTGAALVTSANVLRARLDLVNDSAPPGGYFEGNVTLDVDPGWFLSAEHRDGAVPLRIRFAPSPAFRVLDCRLPVPVPVQTATGARAGHRGRLEMPLWGLLATDVPRGRPVDLEIVATVQACDDSECLAPSDVVLSRRLWVSDDRGTAR